MNSRSPALLRVGFCASVSYPGSRHPHLHYRAGFPGTSPSTHPPVTFALNQDTHSLMSMNHPVAGDPFNLERFVIAQEQQYQQALVEFQRGEKTSHWIWFIFPQFRWVMEKRDVEAL